MTTDADPEPWQPPPVVRAGSEEARRLFAARDCFAAHRWTDGQAAYQQVARLILEQSGPDGLWVSLVDEHVEQLYAADQPSLGVEAAREHLAAVADDPSSTCRGHVQLLVAAGLGQQLAWDECQGLLDHIELAGLSEADRAVVDRLRGLISGYHDDDIDSAKGHLERARDRFVHLNIEAGVAAVSNDLLSLKVRDGDAASVREVVNTAPPSGIASCVAYARSLQRIGRYEQAADVLGELAASDHLDPALEFEVVFQLATAYRRLLDEDAVASLESRLGHAADAAPNSALAIWMTDRLYGADPTLDVPTSNGLDDLDPSIPDRTEALGQSGDVVERRSTNQVLDRVYDLRDAIHRCHPKHLGVEDWSGQRSRIESIGEELDELATAVHSAAAGAHVELLRGELTLAGARLAPRQEVRVALAKRSIELLESCVEQASAAMLLDVRTAAIRSVGDALSIVDRIGAARSCWAQAYEIDRQIAASWERDATRVKYLAGVPDHFDAMVEDSFNRFMQTRAASDAAGFVVQMEAARGSALVGEIVPGVGTTVESLPLPDDRDGCTDWLRTLSDRFDTDQAMWFIHVHPHMTYHAVLARNALEVWRTPAERQQLHDLARTVSPGHPDEVERRVSDVPGESCRRLDEIERLLDAGRPLSRLPDSVRRLVVVADSSVVPIPFAALPFGPDRSPLVRRFAVSELPCATVFGPLRKRANSQRGDDELRILTEFRSAGQEVRFAPSVEGDGLRLRQTFANELESGKWSRCRIDAHGIHDGERPDDSFVRLGPSIEDRLYASELSRLELGPVGLLTLGACESGLTATRGRDEEFGFVRSALLAGGSSVVGAKWIAQSDVAEAILNDFDERLRFATKDVALQQALIAHLDGRLGGLAGIAGPDDPLRWACWTLYGDAGYQTKAGALGRFNRRRRT